MRRGQWIRASLVSIAWLILNSCFSVVVMAGEEDARVPAPKHKTLTGSGFAIGPGSTVETPPDFAGKFAATLSSVRDTIRNMRTGRPVMIRAMVVSPALKKEASGDIARALSTPEGYIIEVKQDGISITGADDNGALNGLTTLESMIRVKGGTLSTGLIVDWPDLRVRALHLVLRSMKPDEIKRIIDSARFGHFNTLILMVADAVRLSTMQGLFLKDAWTKETFLDVVSYARQNGMNVVPEIKLLSHQSYLLKNAYPELMYSKDTYDPRKEATYKKVLPIIDEVLDLIHPRALHIGHDEIEGSDFWRNRDERPLLPPELFLKDVERIHGHLHKRRVETWMWGDMLIVASEFPSMQDKYFHGIQGYAALREKLPRDIVICDWHYFDGKPAFPSADAFARSGYRVLGATWKTESTIRNFSRYVAAMPQRGDGMIASTWFHVQRRERDIVQKIIKTSGEAFWNAR